MPRHGKFFLLITLLITCLNATAEQADSKPFSFFDDITYRQPKLIFKHEDKVLLYEEGSSTPYSGTFVEYYDEAMTIKRAQIEIIDGLAQGKSTMWHKNGVVAVTGNYKDSKVHGEVIDWNKDGVKTRATRFMNGSKHGSDIRWFPGGSKKFYRNFMDGKKDGLQTKWYPNGQKKEEAEYANGKMHGRFLEWYKNGNRKTDGIMEHGKDISGKEWYETGQLKAEFDTKGNTGTVIEYFPHGGKKRQTFYKDGKKDGIRTTWNEEGKIIKTVRYQDGEKVNSSQQR